MTFRRRRMAMHRLAVVTVALLAYLVSALPAAASVIYCISDDGHQGFELVAAGERGCASCCHDEPAEESAHEGFHAGQTECTDIPLSDDQALRSGASFDRDDALSHPVVLPVSVASGGVPLRSGFADVPRAPGRSSAAVLRRHTVLLI